ncbi:MAG: DUF1592 domain-containing protein [Bdellovibrionales bacterium]|nr:DUF1592 domain-containing protein [Bdellovibrionales bacterium]
MSNVPGMWRPRHFWHLVHLSLAATAMILVFQNCTGGFTSHKVDVDSEQVRGGSLQSRFQCLSSEPPIDTVQRLTKYEYLNTLKSIFGETILSDQIVALHLAGLPSDLVLGREEASPIQERHFEAYLGVGIQMGSFLFSSRSLLTKMGISCVGTALLDDICLSRVVEQVGTLFFRRPLNPNEVSFAKDTYTAAPGNASEKFQMLIGSFLVSPEFLFHLELEGGEMENSSLNSYAISDWALASRLSYAIWGTMPDSTLMDAVRAGHLSTQSGLIQEFQRMMADSKARIHLRRLFADWLGFDITPALSFSESFLNGLKLSGLKVAMKDEFDDYVDHIIWDVNGDYFDLMTSQWSKVKSEELAKLYEVTPDPNGLVDFSGKSRRGLIGKATFLSRVGILGTSVPIKRGAFVRAQLLCKEISRPSPQSLPEGVLNPIDIDPNQSTRQVVQAKTSSTSCIGCHSQINPLGFAMENFDPIGRLRTKELIFDSTTGEATNSFPVDARVNLTMDQKEIVIDGGSDLASAIGNSQEGRDCFTQKMFEAMARRKMVSQDECVLESMVGKLQSSNKKGSIREMIGSAIIRPNIRTRRVGAQ